MNDDIAIDQIHMTLEGESPLSNLEAYEAGKFVAEGHKPILMVKQGTVFVGWHDIIEVEHISLGGDCFFNWSKTNSRLLVTELQQVEVLV
ncbi:hypothetical protein Hdeb2414_s0005g00181791 [Helianthus debilis subsp. tardiflorus]